MVGAILLVSVLIFGALAGGVVVHRLDTTPAASSQREQGEQAGDGSQAKKNVKHANHGQHDKQESVESEDKDA
jgi:uncharacterized membrane protein